jgi:D-xylose 1-dehydrogenase (NADP+, D-xylono-1,5-lactone-forming)
MDKILNWGLLSTAKINHALIGPLTSSKRTRLLAVASRSLASAESYAREWKIPRAHGSYEAMLADPEIDVVYNSLPNHLHAEWSIKALRAGKNVLCEKPFALTLAEVDAMTQAAQKTGKVLAEAFMYRHHAQTLMVKELVDSGVLGKIQLIKGAFTFSLTHEGDIRSKKETGGGSIWDIGCYPISYARMIVGADPVEVFGWQVENETGTDDSFYGQMRFANGVHAQFDSGFKSPLRSMIEIVGTEASLNIPHPFKPQKTTEIYLSRGDKQEKIKVRGGELYLGEVEDMCDAITHNGTPRISLADSRGNIATILALLESARLRKPVPLVDR